VGLVFSNSNFYKISQGRKSVHKKASSSSNSALEKGVKMPEPNTALLGLPVLLKKFTEL
jgi:hypothetical protein